MSEKLRFSRSKSLWAATVIATAYLPQAALADERLIREIEGLRNTLSLKDSNRTHLTLRLADLIFDHVNSLNKKLDPGADDLERIRKFRTRAVSLYKEALAGESGRPGVSGVLKTKVQFQLARLFADLGDAGQANPIWKALADQAELVELKREAILRLAEYHEADPATQAQADEYYRKAIELCAQGDACYFPHYRLGWMHHRKGEHEKAITELQLSLLDTKGQVREEALRDLLLFWASAPGDGQRALESVEELAEKISRPNLILDLSQQFFSAGNKVAGIRALEVADSRSPSLRNEIRLLEEYYGVRRWDDFRQLLERVQEKVSSAKLDPKGEEEKILRRLSIQLDGERVSQAALAQDFKTSALLYLALFPNSSLRSKMQEGWLAAEAEAQAKLSQLENWIKEDQSDPSALTRLREHRAAVAQKAGLHSIVAEEMAELTRLAGATPKAREYSYLRGRALYEAKDLDQALPIFQALALESQDRWAVQSQNLALDILNQRKAYGALVAQAESWTQDPARRQATALEKELRDMEQIADQARFEQASAQGEKPEALATFQRFCLAAKFKEKSCLNARILAEKLKDENTLIQILKVSGTREELAAEYEAAGYFAEAAEADGKLSLKVALLFELGHRPADRNRVLEALAKNPQKPASAAEEDLWVQTLIDAQLIQKASLKLPFSENTKRRIAHALEESGKGDAETRKLLLASSENLGPAWSKSVLEEIATRDEKQRKISFIGKNSRARFEKRLAEIKGLAAMGDRYLHGADAQTRVKIASVLAKSHSDLAQEILASPIPAGLPPEAVEQVKASLNEMAAPFQKKADSYQKLAAEQAGQEKGQDRITESRAAAVPEEQRRSALEALHRNPSDGSAIEQLKGFYESQGKQRLASYFEGRLRKLKSEGRYAD